ncbi:hypothetical protein TBR22_A44340 [Luteitalea sp. TBR-22]|uniref:hypothetical protein n=1 Tax=Luteitalea sp. TBR-22 TaxID=2802971 RepID=UPI001AF2C4F6|nr:hypothetical protein [Luteitalea sp. TBR-22]BCS35207.1 hypothetical protein TBR22_A44340 [Luteitalea sp. TBR-22]
MPPRLLVHVLGLCNVVAGALVAFGPGLLMPGADGLGTTAARVFGGSLGAFLAGSAVGAWLMPSGARRPYLWVFGVGVKVVAAALWGTLAVSSGITQLWSGAVVDLAVAALVTTSLMRHESQA